MTLIMKAVEYDKTSAGFRASHPGGPNQLVKEGWWVQPKYDGVFALVTIRGDREDCSIVSRTGEAIRSCEHILNELHSLSYPYPFALIGELWEQGKPFNVISGNARRHTQSPGLQFLAHDMLPTTLQTAEQYRDRYNRLIELTNLLPRSYPVGLVGTYEISDVEEYAAALVAQGGFDGAVIKDPRAGYVIGECKLGQIIKVKPTMSLDLRCVEYKVEKGEQTGRDVLTLAVEYKGVVTWVGSGVPHELTGSMAWGQIVEVECMGITPAGKLREPRFKGIRYDKEKADV